MRNLVGIVMLLALAITITLSFTGCSLLSDPFGENQLGAQLVVQAATARVLEKNKGWADDTVRITNDAIIALQGDAVETILGNLEDYIIGEIDWGKLTPEEGTLLQIVISAAKNDLIDYYKAKGIDDPKEVMVRVAQVLMWVNETAERYNRAYG